MAKDKLFIEAEVKLYSYNKDKVEIDNITSELKYIESQYNGYISMPGEKSVNFSDIKVSKTNSCTPIEDWLLYNNKRYDDLLGKKAKLVNQINKIDNALKILSKPEFEIIKLRYFEPTSWEEVSYKVGYSKSHCKLLRVKSINKIKSII